MEKIALVLTLIGVMLFSVGCTQSPEIPEESIDNNTSVVVNSIDNNTTDTNSTNIVAVVTNDSNKSNTNGTDVVVNSLDNNTTYTNSTNIVTVVTNDSNHSNTNSTDVVAVVTNDSTNSIDKLISKIKNKKLTSSEERKVYTSFNSVSNTYPITINGVKIESYDRTLSYDHINGSNLTACTRTKDVIMTFNNKTKKFKVCQTTNYDWIVK